MARRRRRDLQIRLFDNDPVYTHQHAASVVGEFFECLTAKLFHGHRLQVDDPAGTNPDIETRDGREIESKSGNRGRWLISPVQLEYLTARPGSRFVFWRYPYYRGSLISRFDSKLKIYTYLGDNVQAAYVMSPSCVKVLVDTGTVGGLERMHFLQLKQTKLTAVVSVGHLEAPTGKIHVRKKVQPTLRVLGITVSAFDLFTLDDGSRPEPPPPF